MIGITFLLIRFISASSAIAIASIVYFAWLSRVESFLYDTGQSLVLASIILEKEQAILFFYRLGIATVSTTGILMMLALWRRSGKYYAGLLLVVLFMELPIIFPHSQLLLWWIEGEGIEWLQPLAGGATTIILVATLSLLVAYRSFERWNSAVIGYASNIRNRKEAFWIILRIFTGVITLLSVTGVGLIVVFSVILNPLTFNTIERSTFSSAIGLTVLAILLSVFLILAMIYVAGRNVLEQKEDSS